MTPFSSRSLARTRKAPQWFYWKGFYIASLRLSKGALFFNKPSSEMLKSFHTLNLAIISLRLFAVFDSSPALPFTVELARLISFALLLTSAIS